MNFTGIAHIKVFDMVIWWDPNHKTLLQDNTSRDTCGDSFRRTYGSDSAELHENPVVSPALGSVLPSMLLIFSRSRAREPGDG